MRTLLAIVFLSSCAAPGGSFGVASGPGSTGLIVQSSNVSVAVFATLEQGLSDSLNLYKLEHPQYLEEPHQSRTVEGLAFALATVKEARGRLEQGKPWQPSLTLGLQAVRAVADAEERRWVLPLTTLAGLFLALLESPQ